MLHVDQNFRHKLSPKYLSSKIQVFKSLFAVHSLWDRQQRIVTVGSHNIGNSRLVPMVSADSLQVSALHRCTASRQARLFINFLKCV
jgi:hypothetical protein